MKVLDPLWAMRRKRKMVTGEIFKYKARSNAHGGQQEYGVNICAPGLVDNNKIYLHTIHHQRMTLLAT